MLTQNAIQHRHLHEHTHSVRVAQDDLPDGREPDNGPATVLRMGRQLPRAVAGYGSMLRMRSRTRVGNDQQRETKTKTMVKALLGGVKGALGKAFAGASGEVNDIKQFLTDVDVDDLAERLVYERADNEEVSADGRQKRLLRAAKSMARNVHEGATEHFGSGDVDDNTHAEVLGRGLALVMQQIEGLSDRATNEGYRAEFAVRVDTDLGASQQTISIEGRLEPVDGGPELAGDQVTAEPAHAEEAGTVEADPTGPTALHTDPAEAAAQAPSNDRLEAVLKRIASALERLVDGESKTTAGAA